MSITVTRLDLILWEKSLTPMGKKTKESFKSHQLVSEFMSLSTTSSQTIVRPFWILSLSNRTGRKPCQDQCRRQTHLTLVHLMLWDFKNHHKNTCIHNASRTKSPRASIRNETKQLGVLLHPPLASFCYLWWLSMSYNDQCFTDSEALKYFRGGTK